MRTCVEKSLRGNSVGYYLFFSLSVDGTIDTLGPFLFDLSLPLAPPPSLSLSLLYITDGAPAELSLTFTLTHDSP